MNARRVGRGLGERGTAAFTQALRLFPGHARSQIGLAQCLAAAGKKAEARAALEHARASIVELGRGGRLIEAALLSAMASVAQAGQQMPSAARRSLTEAPPGFRAGRSPSSRCSSRCTPSLSSPASRAVGRKGALDGRQSVASTDYYCRLRAVVLSALSMRVRRRLLAKRVSRALAIAAMAWLAAGCPRETAISLGKPENVADGVQLFRLDDPNLLDLPAGGRPDPPPRPSKVDLRSAPGGATA
jgi:hypothetical protein